MEELKRRNVPCEMQDALRFQSEAASKLVCDLHARGVVLAPKLYAVGVHIAKHMNDTSSHSLCYIANSTYATKLYKYISDNGFDTIIAVHVFPSEALTRIRRKYKEECHFKTYFVGTDYSYPPFLHETIMDTYFIPHPDLTESFVRAGLPAAQVVPTGIPVGDAFRVHVPKEEARATLGLPRDKKIILIMTGSFGFGHVETMTGHLLQRITKDTHLLVMGGNNTRLKARLRELYADDERITILDFTPRVSLYMDACDLLFTKPGGLSSTEAAVKGIPMIHTDPIPGWEEDNILFFRSHGLSEVAIDPDEMTTKALYLLANPWKGEAMVQAQKDTINPEAARDICDYITVASRH